MSGAGAVGGVGGGVGQVSGAGVELGVGAGVGAYIGVAGPATPGKTPKYWILAKTNAIVLRILNFASRPTDCRGSRIWDPKKIGLFRVKV